MQALAATAVLRSCFAGVLDQVAGMLQVITEEVAAVGRTAGPVNEGSTSC